MLTLGGPDCDIKGPKKDTFRVTMELAKKWGSVALSALLMSQIIMVVTILIVSGSTWLISLINKSPRQVMASYPIYKWMNWFGYDPLTKWDDPPSIVMAH